MPDDGATQAREAKRMTTATQPKRLGFFTRLLDLVAPAERYQLALAQILHAERCGFHAAWVAQHHFHEHEGGLPAPFVFLSQVAARTSRIRLGTGIVTLPLELPIRVAEDAAVFDMMSGGRLELGIGPGGNFAAFRAFGLDSDDRGKAFADNAGLMLDALAGRALPGGDTMYPPNPGLVRRMWQATFTVEGARRAGAAGDGLMLSRTQPRPAEAPEMTLADIQNPMIDAYLAALPPGCAPRIMASRSVCVGDSRAEIRGFAALGLARFRDRLVGSGRATGRETLDELIAGFDVHLGTPEDVIASLSQDSTLARATELAVQVHSVDPPHPFILRSLELVAQQVAPALGCVPDGAALRHVA